MGFRYLLRAMLATTVVLGGLAVAAPQGSPAIAALAAIEPGQWQLREIDGPDAKSICVTDPRALIQLHHPGAQCSRFVVSNDPRAATVHYTCPGAGHGRTTIRIETGKLFRLETQGIAAGAPFETVYEARRTGDCTR